jgi:hypothetical protein
LNDPLTGFVCGLLRSTVRVGTERLGALTRGRFGEVGLVARRCGVAFRSRLNRPRLPRLEFMQGLGGTPQRIGGRFGVANVPESRQSVDLGKQLRNRLIGGSLQSFGILTRGLQFAQGVLPSHEENVSG